MRECFPSCYLGSECCVLHSTTYTSCLRDYWLSRGARAETCLIGVWFLFLAGLLAKLPWSFELEESSALGARLDPDPSVTFTLAPTFPGCIDFKFGCTKYNCLGGTAKSNGRQVQTSEEVAIKLESIKSKHPQLLYESRSSMFTGRVAAPCA